MCGQSYFDGLGYTLEEYLNNLYQLEVLLKDAGYSLSEIDSIGASKRFEDKGAILYIAFKHKSKGVKSARNKLLSIFSFAGIHVKTATEQDGNMYTLWIKL